MEAEVQRAFLFSGQSGCRAFGWHWMEKCQAETECLLRFLLIPYQYGHKLRMYLPCSSHSFFYIISVFAVECKQMQAIFKFCLQPYEGGESCGKPYQRHYGGDRRRYHWT